jgi:hypothetical protein
MKNIIAKCVSFEFSKQLGIILTERVRRLSQNHLHGLMSHMLQLLKQNMNIFARIERYHLNHYNFISLYLKLSNNRLTPFSWSQHRLESLQQTTFHIVVHKKEKHLPVPSTPYTSRRQLPRIEYLVHPEMIDPPMRCTSRIRHLSDVFAGEPSKRTHLYAIFEELREWPGISYTRKAIAGISYS